MEEEYLNNRLIKLRKSLNMNQGEFASHIRISQGALSLLENRKTNLSLESLESIIHITHVNPHWLLSGEGEMFDAKDSNSAERSFLKEQLIPLISLEAQAGYLEGGYHTDEYKNTLDYFKVPGFLDDKYRMFQVEGESMKHILHPNDVVITEKKQLTNLEDGQLYVVIAKNELVAKRIYFERDKDLLVLRSENPNFKSYTLKKCEIKEIWIIRGKITKHLTSLDRAYGERLSSLEETIGTLKTQVEALQLK